LLDAGATVDQKMENSVNGTTALLFAAMAGYGSICLQLLKAGADCMLIMDGTSSQFTVLQCCFDPDPDTVLVPQVTTVMETWVHEHGTKQQKAEVARLKSVRADRMAAAQTESAAELKRAQQLQSRAQQQELVYAARAGDEARVSLLLKQGVSPDAFLAISDSEGDGALSALMVATAGGHLNTVAVLLDAGATVDQTTESGITALLCAATAGHGSICLQLLEAGADCMLEISGSSVLAYCFDPGPDAIIRPQVTTVMETWVHEHGTKEQKAEVARLKSVRADKIAAAQAESAAELKRDTLAREKLEEQRQKRQRKRQRQKEKQKQQREPEPELQPELQLEPQPQPEPEPEPEPAPEPEPESAEEAAARERMERLARLTAVALGEWSEEQVQDWLATLELPSDCLEAVRSAFEDNDMDGEELESCTPKRLLKMLKKQAVDEPQAVADAIMQQRDKVTAGGGAPGSDLNMNSSPSRSHMNLRVEFDRAPNGGDWLGSGRLGNVFKCSLDGVSGYAVKRVDIFKSELVMKEIEVLTGLSVKSNEGGHVNVVRYFCREQDQDFIYICMELCDKETLATRVREMVSMDVRTQAVKQLFAGIDYLHRLKIVHRDLKPANILFKGDVLKICDMGQSRRIEAGHTAVETGSDGGTFGWMTPEEITAAHGRHQMDGEAQVFEARLSGDIHTAGSLMFFILSGGLHAFGPRAQTPDSVNGDWFAQQQNLVKGRFFLKPLGEASGSSFMACACDLFVRMVRTDEKQRPVIADVMAHPALWTAEQKLSRCTDWHKSWERGTPALERRLAAHPSSVRRIIGDRPEGWLAKLDPAVVQRLTSGGRHYGGRDVTELLRAIRNISEHWFSAALSNADAEDVAVDSDDAALEALTGCSAAETRRGQASADAASRRAQAIERYFLRDDAFADLLLVFELPNAAV
jgi:serine/threonine protein kinase